MAGDLVRSASRHDDRGSALLVTLLTAMLVSGLAGALTVVLMTEEAVEANHRRGMAAFYAADGLLTRVLAELTRATDWQVLVEESGRSTFSLGSLSARLADGSLVDLTEMTAALADEPVQVSGAAAPRWRLYAWGWFADLIGDAGDGQGLFVAAWVFQETIVTLDPDDDPVERMVVRAMAFGPFRARRAVEAVLHRVSGVVEVAAWDLVR